MLVKILVPLLILSMNAYVTYWYLDTSNKKKVQEVSKQIFSKIENKYSAGKQKIILLKLNRKVNLLKKQNTNKNFNNEILSYFQENIIDKVKVINESEKTIDNQLSNSKITSLSTNNNSTNVNNLTVKTAISWTNPTTTTTVIPTNNTDLVYIGKKIETWWLTYISQNKEFSDFMVSNKDSIVKISGVISKSLIIYSHSNKNNLEVIISNIDWYISSNNNKELFTEVNKSLKSAICNYYESHNNISASIFWVWEWEDESNNYISNVMSAWDWKWLEHHNNWTENHFYVALPYNDFDEDWNRRSNVKNLPWYNGELKDNVSYVKNRWVKVEYKWKIAYGQWEDVWPLLENDFDYVFWKWKVNNTFGLNAWIDLSPEFASYLWFNWSWNVNWNFIPEYCVPEGSWKKIITKNNITW